MFSWIYIQRGKKEEDRRVSEYRFFFLFFFKCAMYSFVKTIYLLYLTIMSPPAIFDLATRQFLRWSLIQHFIFFSIARIIASFCRASPHQKTVPFHGWPSVTHHQLFLKACVFFFLRISNYVFFFFLITVLRIYYCLTMLSKLQFRWVNFLFFFFFLPFSLRN